MAEKTLKNEPGAFRYSIHKELNATEGGIDIVMVEKYVSHFFLLLPPYHAFTFCALTSLYGPYGVLTAVTEQLRRRSCAESSPRDRLFQGVCWGFGEGGCVEGTIDAENCAEDWWIS